MQVCPCRSIWLHIGGISSGGLVGLISRLRRVRPSLLQPYLGVAELAQAPALLRKSEESENKGAVSVLCWCKSNFPDQYGLVAQW